MHDVQQMEGDPLLENLDGLLPINDSSVPVVPANLPSAVEDICKALMEEDEIEAVDIGRQVKSRLFSFPFARIPTRLWARTGVEVGGASK